MSEKLSVLLEILCFTVKLSVLLEYHRHVHSWEFIYCLLKRKYYHQHIHSCAIWLFIYY